MSRPPRSLRFLRLAALAVVVAACLIGYATYLQARSGVTDGPVPLSVFVAMAAILGSALNQPFRDDDSGGDQSHRAASRS
ncbi:MAG: hypothetical protein AAFX65_05590 [Cyanobacteria bacterium J06638_7]